MDEVDLNSFDRPIPRIGRPRKIPQTVEDMNKQIRAHEYYMKNREEVILRVLKRQDETRELKLAYYRQYNLLRREHYRALKRDLYKRMKEPGYTPRFRRRTHIHTELAQCP
jgi:hypothetical protein